MPAGVDLNLAGDALYQVVRLLEMRGIRVLHPGMVIGDTGIRTPVDLKIQAWSSHGYEELVVGTRVITTHKEGYNLVAVHPRTGSIEATLRRGVKVSEIESFVRSIPNGHIVVGKVKASNVRDGASRVEIMQELREAAREAEGGARCSSQGSSPSQR